MAFKYPETKKYLTTYGNQVENEILTRLHNFGKYASGKLYDSIGYNIKETDTKFTLTFVMEYYGQFVDKGIKPSKYANSKRKGRKGGKSKFIEALMKWCRIKGIPVNAAFPIRAKIWRDGIAPTNFFTIPTTRRIKQFEKGVEKAMAKDVESIIKKGAKK